MSTPPLVSFIIPAMNASATVGGAIQSALSQTYPACEVIVVDDGSTDSTWETISAFDDVRVRAFRLERNMGRGAARNRAVAEASGDYLVMLDADDIALPERVEATVSILELSPSVVIAGGQAIFEDEVLGRWRLRRYPLLDAEIRAELNSGVMSVCHGGSTIRRQAFESIGGYDVSLTRAQDFDLVRRLSHLGEMRSSDIDVLVYRHPVILRFQYWAQSRRFSKRIVTGVDKPVSATPINLLRFAVSTAKRLATYLLTRTGRR